VPLTALAVQVGPMFITVQLPSSSSVSGFNCVVAIIVLCLRKKIKWFYLRIQ